MDNEAHARNGDPMVSHEAAATVDVSRDKRAVLWALWHTGGILTDGWIWDFIIREYPHAHGTQQSIRSRRAELMREDCVGVAADADGFPIYGMTANHRRCRLYGLTPKGKELADMLFG